MSSDIRHLVTHSGMFHADEVFAAAILSILHPQARLVRTRDRALIEKLAPQAITFDVGGAFDADRRIFDHHQTGAPAREDGTPYSSAGLVWRQYGMDWLAARGVPEEFREAVFGSIDRNVILPIDLVDSGRITMKDLGPGQALSLISIIEDMNPETGAGDGAAERAFREARTIAGTMLDNRASKVLDGLVAERKVIAALQAQWGEPILVLERGMPFRRAIEKAAADHVLFVVSPRATDWKVDAVAQVPGEYALRHDLPEAWAGLEHEALEEASGVGGAIFCHRNRFMACAKTRDGALDLARRALPEDPSPTP
ncbi:MYG1 family protein [Cereibacter sphaeroides]|uniref:MYG1 family protein n=1 Tax=Cereibacter sphaeroides TaxID=1063 RepID=UPI001F2E1C65|nr:MYG1 family protein [Cereibacter sphaeroides]MCE6958262.1 MYG1 family protein [Cereibacter sphaeroides]MCE6971201.1 MYG1 family protein [Cereibacter sphaeroides]